jgi:DNA polymerase-3 subunit epsilon
MEFAIVDIETTGGRSTEDKIIEIAIVIHDGLKIIDEFQTLINPEKYIPDAITRLTGISNDVVKEAPRFFEVAKKIVEITKDRIFVAHNVHFDYTFVRQEFASLGYNYKRKCLCTVRLSRKIFKGVNSYSLGNLTKYFEIEHQNAHRAMSDAKATALLFAKLFEKDKNLLENGILEGEIKAKNLPPKLDREKFESLPEDVGVYYFYDENNDLIYIGKSNNIKQRVASHFSTNVKSRKTIEFKNRVADISYQLTGSELLALLFESDEIKKHKPVFNKAQRNSRFYYGIFSFEDKAGYRQFYVDKIITQPFSPLIALESSEKARRLLYSLVQKYELCMKLCQLYKAKKYCFDYQIKKCKGACIQEEAPEKYNQRAEKAMKNLHAYAGKSFTIITKGKNTQELGIVVVENGRYLGFGYMDKSQSIQNIEDAKIFIKKMIDNRDVQQIIGKWIEAYPKSVHFF